MLKKVKEFFFPTPIIVIKEEIVKPKAKKAPVKKTAAKKAPAKKTSAKKTVKKKKK